MTTLLVKNADVVLTMHPDRPTLKKGGLFVRDNVIEQVGESDSLPQEADRIVDAAGMIVAPGLINTHHHLYQTLTRAVPGANDAELFDWLVRLYPIWGEMTQEAVYTSAFIGMAEMILSGCTTTTDHLYLYPNDCTIDAEIKAARDLGMRFQPTRGSMSLGRSKGGLPPDHVVQEEDVILRDCQRAIEQFHDPKPYAMVRIGLAPCSPFSVTTDLMIEAARLARTYEKVLLHTHVAETRDEEQFCIDRFGARPAAYMERVGWTGPDVWWAHAIYLNDEEIRMLAETRTGVAHCPSSNMRLGSGIAKIREMRDAGVKVGLAIDGSASNDTCNVIGEARNALLLQRVAKGAAAFTVMDALTLGTIGSAAVLNRDDIGQLAAGKAADFVGVKLNRLEMAGAAVHDPVAALLLCPPHGVDMSFINGRQVVADGKLAGVALEPVIERHNALAREMVARHPMAS
jgi:cytosine/adenosine deaminase-related metal-dependent hydrolase